jgi:hypothetical protein
MALGRIIDRLRRSNREQRKLLLSLGTHVGTRIPGAVGVLWFLPLLYADLGTADYSKLLTALALGGAAGFLSGGFNYAGRRLIGEAYSVLDRKDEADSFASLVVANLLAQCVMLAAIGVYCWMQGASIGVFITAIIPVSTQFIAQFDDVRAAYNELYISSTILIILQTVIYAIGIMVPATRQNMVLGALVMMGPYMLSSLLSLVLLLRSRPYLLRGRPRRVRLVMQQGTMFAMADGLIMAALSLSVVWFHTVASAEASAYYATIVRLFQTFLAPIVMVLFPLSSYIRLFWKDKTNAQRQFYTKSALWLGLGYGAVVTIALLILSRLYVVWLLHLTVLGDLLQVLPIFCLFGAIVAYKSYSQIAYIVFHETAHLSAWTAMAVGIAITIGVAANFAVEPLSAISIYAMIASLSMVFVLFWNVARFMLLLSHNV